ncbi:MAG TPA: hypothetical protein VEL75_11885 [Candidatus Methylomirabilis sp.]|nr:hypothetical protein [Candidatus Methylomirabilis sp.]
MASLNPNPKLPIPREAQSSKACRGGMSRQVVYDETYHLANIARQYLRQSA